MSKRFWIVGILLCIVLPVLAAGQDSRGVSEKYKALKYTLAPASGTWAVLDRDGANRQVEPYLSSLGSGESGTGVIASPPFSCSTDAITFTICGHDGQGGGRGTDFIALVDVETGKVLKKTMAPGADPLQERSWDVAEFKGRKVRIEVRDGNTDGAFAWLGIGKINAGPSLRIDFRKGMPKDWKAESKPADQRTEVVEGGIPFRRHSASYTMTPKTGALEIPCGFRAERLFVLGCTVASGMPLTVYGYIEILYRGGASERVPLMFGYTLDGEGKLPSDSTALHIHRSGDQFQHYLVLAPRPEVIDAIRLERNAAQPYFPRITAITCETPAESEALEPLPDCDPSPEEKAWIRSHTISRGTPDLNEIAKEILRAHKM